MTPPVLDRDAEKAAAEYFARYDSAEDRKAAYNRVSSAVKLAAPLDSIDPPPGLKFETGLGKIARGERKPPRHIVDGLILENALTWLDGHPDSGKSTIASHVAVEHMRAGGHVVWVDWEAGKVGVVDRLMAAGAQVAHLDDESP